MGLCWHCHRVMVTAVIAAFGYTFVAIFGEFMTAVLIAGIFCMCAQVLMMSAVSGALCQRRSTLV